jgi:hypothetical protein
MDREMDSNDLYDCIIEELDPEDLELAELLAPVPGSAEEELARETDEFIALPTEGGLQ